MANLSGYSDLVVDFMDDISFTESDLLSEDIEAIEDLAAVNFDGASPEIIDEIAREAVRSDAFLELVKSRLQTLVEAIGKARDVGDLDD